MASPPFNPNEAVPADASLVSAFPAAERTFRDIVESWILFEHGRSGHHVFPSLTTSERDAITTWEVGSLIYNETTERLEFCNAIGPVTWLSCIGFDEPVQGTDTVAGLYETATPAEVYAATAAKVITAALLETAGAPVALVDAAPVLVDWDAGINFTLTVSADRQIDNPTNGQPGTSRTITIKGSDGTDRAITWDTNYKGDIPVTTDCDNGKWYKFNIYCHATDHYSISRGVALKP